MISTPVTCWTADTSIPTSVKRSGWAQIQQWPSKWRRWSRHSIFGFKQRGAVAPGYRADLVVVPDLESFTVEQVYKNGTLVAEHGKTLKPAPLDIDRVRFSHVMDSFDLDEITLQDLELREAGSRSVSSA